MPPGPDPERPLSLSAGCVRAILGGRKTLVRHVAADPCPLGEPGDWLWVREPWAPGSPGGSAARYQADGAEAAPGVEWQPARTMPRELSRLRLERLRDIPDEDLPAEGRLWREGAPAGGETEREGFARWWDSLHARPGTRWADDPWVWVLGVRPCADPPDGIPLADSPPDSASTHR